MELQPVLEGLHSFQWDRHCSIDSVMMLTLGVNGSSQRKNVVALKRPQPYQEENKL